MNGSHSHYLIRRAGQFIPTIAAILLIGFLLIHLAPGDPVLALAGDNGDAQYYADMRARFGLDEPLPVQLAKYAGNLVTGDLGTSYMQGRPVAEIIAERLPATVLLTASALLISALVGVAVGVYAATRHNRLGDHVVTATTLAVYAAPVFLLGQLAILVLALRTGWFPVQGMTDPRGDTTSLRAGIDVAHHLALPMLVLAAQEVAAVAQITRAGMVNELGSDHVRTARAKGVTERVVLTRHALRRVLPSVVTVLGERVGHLVAGAVVVEAVFGWPGIGRLLVTAMQSRDIPIVMGVFLIVAVTVVIANLLTDLLYVKLDPRVRLG
ncbi:MAG TPA: ABC transporter permease [Mycobacterium sp.]|nr:ABC transporter permease [Mycobacterium sp.]